ncbi:MAG: sigma-70 family RNA polymerase sigma factor, partial [Dehalococcoidia bacterium]
MTLTPPSGETGALEIARVEGARRGDREAFTTLVRDYGPLVDRVVRSIVRDADDADDVAQEVWITVSERLPQLRQPHSFRAWLARIARNRSLGWLRSRHAGAGTNATRTLAELPAPATDQPDAPLVAAEHLSQLWEALGRLSVSDRRALLLRVSEQRPYDEIGRMLGISRAAAEVRVSRARGRLRSLVATLAGAREQCGTSALALGELVAGALGADEAAALNAHAAACTPCTARLDALNEGASLYRQFGVGALPVIGSATPAGHGVIGQALAWLAQCLPGHGGPSAAGAAGA